MRRKKGFAALVIVVVAFSLLMAIGITAVTKLVELRYEGEVSCGDVKLSIEKTKIAGKEFNVCRSERLTTSDISFVVVNSGKKSITGIDVKMEGSKGIEKKEVNLKLKKGLSSKQNVGYDKLKYGELKKLSIIPVFGRQDSGCFESIISTEDIGDC